MLELLLGCGSSREKRIWVDGNQMWGDLITLDRERRHQPDVVWDLNELPLPFTDDLFDGVHAYEVVEHFGRQGDAGSFFDFFNDLWRVLKPGGLFCATVPAWDTQWAWGDPSHRRVITPGTLVFLDQTEYGRQVGKTTMSDFRSIYRGDFECIWQQSNDGRFMFALRAVKPARVDR